MRAVAFIIVGLLIAAAIAWDASERHYDACVNAAKAIPDTRTALQRQFHDYGAKRVSPANALEQRIKGCSRLPW